MELRDGDEVTLRATVLSAHLPSTNGMYVEVEGRRLLVSTNTVVGRVSRPREVVAGDFVRIKTSYSPSLRRWVVLAVAEGVAWLNDVAPDGSSGFVYRTEKLDQLERAEE